jgi:hypothetical protein
VASGPLSWQSLSAVVGAGAASAPFPGCLAHGERVLVGEVASDWPGARHRSEFGLGGILEFACILLLLSLLFVSRFLPTLEAERRCFDFFSSGGVITNENTRLDLP